MSRLWQNLVQVRNDKVTLGLRRTYQPVVQHVFCVSNTMYLQRRDGPLKWLQLSSIIALRRHCLGLIADHQLQDAMIFMKSLIPNLVTSIDLWVRAGSENIAAETRAKIRAASEAVERNILNVRE
jgi:hypothetical protein